MLLDDTTEQEAVDFCHRLGSKIEFETNEGNSACMTYSFGMCQLNKHHRTVEDWFAEADQHMYRDKENSKHN